MRLSPAGAGVAPDAGIPVGGALFGSIGGFELLVLAAIGLLVFGPRRLPELGRSLGRTLTELRRAAGEMKATIEQEADLGEVKRTAADIKEAIRKEAGRVFSDLEAEARVVEAAVKKGEEEEREPGGTSPP